ncbi:MAG: transcriptional regulator [Anaerocolumna sp.]|jgi:AcrR family transcriptional regulator|nr:transcriptional regulator [Anaerocolumna sp.]
MNQKFENLDLEKKERIITASLEEFAKKGYKNASTNEIVKNASISKGLLFHYFSSKKILFGYLLRYSTNIFIKEFYDLFDFKETDLIKRWRQLTHLKLKLIHNHPVLYEFILTSTSDNDKEISGLINSIQNGIAEEFYKRVVENIDTSVFKDNLDKGKVCEMVIWVIQGYSNKILEKFRADNGYNDNLNLDSILKEFDEYLDLLKDSFYKSY